MEAPAIAATKHLDLDAVGQTFFVATNGYDDRRGDGSMDRPFATIRRAIEAAWANGLDGGDQVVLRAGTYYPGETILLSENGNPQRWSRLAAWRDEHVVIDGSLIAPTHGRPNPTIFVAGSYYEISGLELAHSPE